MIEIYTYTIGSVAVVSLISLIGILTLSLKERVLHSILFVLVSVAAGALFGDALIHLIPEAIENAENEALVPIFVLAGILFFFILEKFLRWKHIHDVENECENEIHEQILVPEGNVKIKPLGHLVIVSDGIHNFIDGIIIAISYLVSIEVGIATTIAIILHEIPQEISDFGVLMHAGFKKMKAIFINFLSALSAIVGAVLALVVGTTIESFIPLVVAFAAGSFLYIAGSDLVPEIHKTSHPGRSLIQFLAILLGVSFMLLLLLLE